MGAGRERPEAASQVRQKDSKAYDGLDANDSVMCKKRMSFFILANAVFSSSTFRQIKELHMSMERYPTSCGMLSDSNVA